MKIAKIDYIEELPGKSSTPFELLARLKSKMRDLPAQPEAIIFASVSVYSLSNYLYGHDIGHFLNVGEDIDIYHVTGGCYVGLQAMQMAQGMMSKPRPLEHVLVIALDNLTDLVSAETIQQRSSAVRWGNGAAFALLSRRQDGISILDFKSQTDHRWYEDYSIQGSERGEPTIHFKLSADQYTSDFAQEDLKKATELVQGLSARNGLQRINGLICLNRGGKFSQRLGQNLGLDSQQVIESFESRGHLGAADLFMNLHDFTSQENQPGTYAVYSCGYGYTRAAALIEIERK